MREELALTGRLALHVDDEVGQAPEEALVVIRIEIIPALVQPLEAPAVELPRERLILAQDKELGHQLRHEPLLVVDLPRAAVGLGERGVGGANGGGEAAHARANRAAEIARASPSTR